MQITLHMPDNRVPQAFRGSHHHPVTLTDQERTLYNTVAPSMTTTVTRMYPSPVLSYVQNCHMYSSGQTAITYAGSQQHEAIIGQRIGEPYELKQQSRFQQPSREDLLHLGSHSMEGLQHTGLPGTWDGAFPYSLGLLAVKHQATLQQVSTMFSTYESVTSIQLQFAWGKAPWIGAKGKLGHSQECRRTLSDLRTFRGHT